MRRAAEQADGADVAPNLALLGRVPRGSSARRWAAGGTRLIARGLGGSLSGLVRLVGCRTRSLRVTLQLGHLGFETRDIRLERLQVGASREAAETDECETGTQHDHALHTSPLARQEFAGRVTVGSLCSGAATIGPWT